METKQPHKKHRIRRPISTHHKEPIAAASAGLLLLVLLVVFGLGVFMIRDYVNYDEFPKLQTNKSAVVTVNKNEPKLTARVISHRFSDGDQAFMPMPDMHFVIVDTDIVHHLDAPAWLSPLLQSYLKDSAGKKYELSPVTLERPFDARQYKIGEHATGELSYMVPKNASGLSWCYEIGELKLKACEAL
jgi:hypothetical protein